MRLKAGATLGIDASNIQGGGGGVTHLFELLEHARPDEFGFGKVVVWGGGALLKQLPTRDWLTLLPISDDSLSARQLAVWNFKDLRIEFSKQQCNLLFSPGGTFVSKTIPYVSMSQNMLLFEDVERRRFPYGWNRFRYNVLRLRQSKSFKYAKGIIFLSNYAKELIQTKLPFCRSLDSRVIYHGVNSRFGDGKGARTEPPFTFLYVSTVNYYKHQWNVVQAIEELNEEGVRCNLRLVGGSIAKPMLRLEESLVDSQHATFVGRLEYGEIDQEYRNADGFVFASTCENMPNILVEAMAAGLPIACSSYGPMREVANDAALFMDPTDVESIKESLRQIVVSRQLRDELAAAAIQRSQIFTWEQTADLTFDFFSKCLDAV